ncbi:MAG: branched-chain amino acid ABC transporter permease [Betaproteobacteria bacterium]|nr:branched-chain amino acid ABC transporter permease [Betaproteobacteria bacterium]
MVWLQRTVDGLLEAGPYALIGLGLTLGFGVMRRLNLAYGAGALLAAYLGSWMFTRLGLPAVWVWASVLVATVVVGLYIDLLCFAGTDPANAGLQRGQDTTVGLDARQVTALAASFALWMQLEQLAVNWQPSHVHPFPDVSATTEWTLGALSLRPDRLATFALTVVMVWGVARWIERSTIGLGLRAVSSQVAAAHLSGMRVQRLQRLGFALACLLSGIATCTVLSMDGQVTPMFGMWLLIKGLAVAMLAGLGAIRGVLVGAMVLGVLESHAQAAWGPLAREATAWALLLAALLWRARRSRTDRLGACLA